MTDRFRKGNIVKDEFKSLIIIVDVYADSIKWIDFSSENCGGIASEKAIKKWKYIAGNCKEYITESLKKKFEGL